MRCGVLIDTENSYFGLVYQNGHTNNRKIIVGRVYMYSYNKEVEFWIFNVRVFFKEYKNMCFCNFSMMSDW